MLRSIGAHLPDRLWHQVVTEVSGVLKIYQWRSQVLRHDFQRIGSGVANSQTRVCRLVLWLRCSCAQGSHVSSHALVW
jgi:hypothetical protein